MKEIIIIIIMHLNSFVWRLNNVAVCRVKIFVVLFIRWLYNGSCCRGNLPQGDMLLYTVCNVSNLPLLCHNMQTCSFREEHCSVNLNQLEICEPELLKKYGVNVLHHSVSLEFFSVYSC